MAYSDKVIDHFQHPRNVGSFGTSKEVKERKDIGVGIVGAPECGDVMQLQIKVADDGRIEDAKFKCFGCGSAIASSSLATEWIKGKTLDEAASIRNTQIVEELSLPPVKIHCSVLAEDSIRIAIDDFCVGHASIRYLFQLQPDFLKLDLSYSQRLHDANVDALVEFLVRYGALNNCGLILEGIETQEQLHYWQARGVELFQGYLFRQPTGA